MLVFTFFHLVFVDNTLSLLLLLASLKVMLICGSDLLESFSTPKVWIPEQVRTICRDYGVVCIRREGQDIEKLIASDEILNEFKSNIKIVDEIVPNRISSTIVRDCVSRSLSVKYLVADEMLRLHFVCLARYALQSGGFLQIRLKLVVAKLLLSGHLTVDLLISDAVITRDGSLMRMKTA
ncbi:hypothetical protein POM88_028187 [Heracleum sosnowskyi]|uniref:Cytidyltransferase-like domain-containing protein n=1 Tax=Heracleum sosnowskyi TaxID=360622 RepID=A0AAD8IA45_9APIA|nr:hypothetical protein POM88_028187 [Heracleum sosnowskyi]